MRTSIVNFRVDEELLSQFDLVAKSTNQTRTDYITKLMTKEINDIVEKGRISAMSNILRIKYPDMKTTEIDEDVLNKLHQEIKDMKPIEFLKLSIGEK